MSNGVKTIADFTDNLVYSCQEGTFIKITLSNKRNPSSDLNNVYVKPVMIKDQVMLSFVYRHKTKDITRNYDIIPAVEEISKLLETDFTQALLATTLYDYQLLISKKGTITILKKPSVSKIAPDLKHDKVKQRIIGESANVYLYELGIMNQEGRIRQEMQDKFRQINKYIEIVDGIIKDVELPETIKVADMGAGKGYLTFAIYDYLTNKKNKKVELIGIEVRNELIDQCNVIATNAGFDGLEFKQGTIEKADLPNVDILIALHACDTATDEAIYKGIKAGAQVIVCSPCCHKQVRKSMETTGVLAEITQFGILAERQAEILTDTIRALVLEAYGYRTNIAEFVATEHTPKNLIISAVKKKLNPEYHKLPNQDVIATIEALKKQFNLKSHYLQDLLLKNADVL